MKTIILISLVFACWITVRDKRKQAVSPKPVTGCFTCDTVSTGTIFCDDFEVEQPLETRYFEYNNDEGDFVRLPGIGRDSSAGMRVVWQRERWMQAHSKDPLEERLMTILANTLLFLKQISKRSIGGSM